MPLAELVGKLVREERYHLMHIATWFDRLARTDGEPRRRLIDALATLAPDAGTVFTPLPGEPVLVEAGILAAPMRELESRWLEAIAPTLRALDLPQPTSPGAPADGREGHGEAFRWLWGEFTNVRRSDPGATW